MLPATHATPRTLNGFDLRGALVPVEAIEQGGPPRDGFPSTPWSRALEQAVAGPLKAAS